MKEVPVGLILLPRYGQGASVSTKYAQGNSYGDGTAVWPDV